MKPTLCVGCLPSRRPAVERLLNSIGFSPRWADTEVQAAGALDECETPVLLDLSSDHAIAVARAIRARRPRTVMIAIADRDRPAATARAVQEGILHVLPRPLVALQLASMLRTASVDCADASPCEPVFADSPAMLEVLNGVQAAAARRVGVLIVGPPATGRGFFARTVHRLAHPPEAPFVELDCGRTLKPDLEAALFGTGLGSTAPPADRNGVVSIGSNGRLFEARGGSLLLVNLSDMPARLQSRLARVLRDGEALVDDERHADVTVLPMAKLDPRFEASVDDGRLRQDLYRRLSDSRIDVPPLRNRREDIPALAAWLLMEICQRAGEPVRRLTYPAVTLLSALPYRGNVAELRATLESIVQRVPHRAIRLDDVLSALPMDDWPKKAPSGATLRQARMRFEREYITAVLEQHHGRIAEAARILGIQRENLYRKLRRLGLSPQGARTP